MKRLWLRFLFVCLLVFVLFFPGALSTFGGNGISIDRTGPPIGSPLDNDFGSNGIMERTGAGTYGIATEGTDYYGPGRTDVAVADGGTGSSTAVNARTALGLVIGTNVQAFDADLGKFVTVEESADAVTLTAAECSDTLVTNRGWDGNDNQTFTLPDADTVVGAGLKFKLLIVVASGATADTYIDTEGSTTNIYLDGTAIGDGERVWTQEPAVGESIVCHTATIDGTTYDWFCDSVNGTWADKGS